MKSISMKLAPALLYATSILFTSVSSASESPVVTGEDVEQVKNSIVTMVNAIDTKQWDVATAQFAEEVYVDYSSLSGQPGSMARSADLVGGWEQLLENVSTHHLLSNFDISIQDDQAESFSHVYASHLAEGIEYWDAFGRYHHKLQKLDGQWKITSKTLIMYGQKGNVHFLQEVIKMNETNTNASKLEAEKSIQKVHFNSDGETVVGNLFFPDNYDSSKQYPAVIVSGSWTTVKEQMAGLYAGKLAKEGFITLAFDFRNFGESEGAPRFYENPTQKVEDIRNAITYLESLPTVDGSKIGALGICAGSMYTLMAAAEDTRIKSVVTAASWLHDAEAVKLFYGGEEGVQEKINAAQAAKKQYAETGKVEYIPSISTTDVSAAMYGPYDYYLNTERGAIPEWSADKFAVMTWEDWLTLDPMPSAENLNTPTLMIHSDGAVLPQYTKRYFDKIATDDKALYWMETELESPFHQFSFYDQEAEVNESIEQAKQWFAEKL